MSEKYVCGICGKTHYSLDDYLTCVAKCGEKLKAIEKEKEEKAEKERLEKINAALNRIKQAKSYYEEQLAKFQKEYPDEYKLNFGEGCKEKCKESYSYSGEPKTKTLEFTYEKTGKEEPKVSAKVNGKDVKESTDNTLTEDPYVRSILKMLGIA